MLKEAIMVLRDLAKSPAKDNFPLKKRIEFLSRARNCAKSLSSSAPEEINADIVAELSDRIDVINNTSNIYF